MATRKERWLKMRRKHQNKLRRWRNCGWRWTLPGALPKRRLSRRWFLPTIGFMDPLRLAHSNLRHFPLNDPGTPLLIVSIEKLGKRRWPIARLSGPVADLWHSRTWHVREAYHGYRLRRLRLFGPLPGKMTVWQRRCWAANWFYMSSGYFLDVDPAGRRPNETDIDGGAPPDDPIAWPGIPPQP